MTFFSVQTILSRTILSSFYLTQIIPTGIVNGGWSGWGVWSQCSATCNPGQRSRERACNNPSPRNGGANCTGSPIESEPCQVQFCSGEMSWDESKIVLIYIIVNALFLIRFEIWFNKSWKKGSHAADPRWLKKVKIKNSCNINKQLQIYLYFIFYWILFFFLVCLFFFSDHRWPKLM